MGLFDIFKKKEKKQEESGNSVLLAMPLFTDNESYSFQAVVNDLKEYWGLDVDASDVNDQTAVFQIEGCMVALANMGAPVPWGDIESTADYTYLWSNVLEDCKKHTSHALATIMSGGGLDAIERFKILTKLNASVLRTSPTALGVYQGSQTLLIPKELYLEFADSLLEDSIPVALWVYIGLVGDGNENSIYTYGMKTLGKQEIEIINSDLSKNDLYDFLVPVLAYILEYDVTLKNGETIGFSAEQKIKITESEGVFVEGNTLKLEL